MDERPQLVRNEQDLPANCIKKDTLENSLIELFFIEHPECQKTDSSARTAASAFAKKSDDTGVWAYYPWKQVAIRIPREETYFNLRTARNRNLITEKEQTAYRNAIIGVAGLSVGSAALQVIVATGGPKQMKLADPDTIEISNLNRIKASLPDIAENKATVAARSVYELDPFAEIEVWREGISKESLKRFVCDPTLSVFVDEMDSIELKFAAREVCKQHHVPVVMATDNGEGAILDVERFDLELERPVFHGRVTAPVEGFGVMDRRAFVELANQIIDPALFSPRQRESIQAIGKTLSGVAQIATGASVAGAAVAFAVRLVTTGGTLPSGRYVISPEELLSQARA